MTWIAIHRMNAAGMYMDLKVGHFLWIAGIILILLPTLPLAFAIPFLRWLAAAAAGVIALLAVPLLIALTMHPAGEKDDFLYVVAWTLKEPLLYGGVATAFDFTNAATSITLAFASVLFGIAGWGLYRFKNWARLFTVASVFTFLPMLGNLPPFYVDSFTATTAFLPFIVPYGLMSFYFRREDVRQLFA